MKLRYEKETKVGGLLVLESEPQARVKSFYSQISNGYSKLYFPYIYFCVKYHKSEGSFVYPGAYVDGLKVFFSLKPLESFKSTVYYSPIDFEYKGYVCTSHEWDKSEYDTLEDLVNQVVSLWWGTKHVLEQNLNNSSLKVTWDKIKSFEELQNYEFKSAGKFYKTFGDKSEYSSYHSYKRNILDSFSISDADDAEIYSIHKDEPLIDRPWGQKFTLDVSKILEEIALQNEDVVV